MSTTPVSGSANVEHSLTRRLGLGDLVLAQVLYVVGSAWVGIAAGLGHAQTLVWLAAMSLFFAPMAVAVYFLNREMPLEGGLYVWARRAFGDTLGFLTAWNIWAYGLVVIATVYSQLPTEFAYMAGPRAAWFPENHPAVLGTLAVLLMALAASAYRGLALGKWIHNVSGAAIMLAFALLIVAPLYAWLHRAPIHYTPLEFHLPPRNLTSFALIGQVLFAASGLEYIAILAGETRNPSRNIGRSVILSAPIIVCMFVLGTASVLAFHELHPAVAINYIAPIPQALVLAFGDTGLGHWLAVTAIFLLQVRILGTSSLLFTGLTRLPMAAGWDDLIPAWFARLNPRHQTPVSSILVSTAVIGVLLLLAFAGTHAAEAFAILNNASSALYGLAYLAMFLIPIAGARALRDRLPLWVAVVCGVGFCATLFTVALQAYPFLDVPNPLAFALKISMATALINVLGYAFYRSRRTLATTPS